MVKFFKTPFASNGDKLNIPDELQEDGSISFDEGYGEDYEKNRKTDPDAKNISRQSFNGLLYDITDAIGDIQRSGVAKWSDEVTYSKGSLVWHNKSLYSSLLDSNKSQPPSASWTTLLTKESLDLTEYRKKDDNIFNGLMTIKSDNVEQGVGIFLQDTDGTTRGQVVATDQGLQLTQYTEAGGLQTFTFPSEGDGELSVSDVIPNNEFNDAISSGRFGIIADSTPITLSTLNVDKLHLLSKYKFEVPVTINIPLGNYKVTRSLVINSDISNLTIEGDSLGAPVVSKVTSVEEGSFTTLNGFAQEETFKYFKVNIDAELVDGGYYKVSTSDGVFSGVFEAIDLKTLLVQAEHFPNDIQLTVSRVNTVLIYDGEREKGISAVVVEGSGELGKLDTLCLVGKGRAINDSTRGFNSYDAYGSGGSSGVVVRDGGVLRTNNLYMSGWSSNGIAAARNATVVCSGDTYVSSGGRNGIVSSSSSLELAKGNISSGCLNDGYELQDGGFMYAHSGVSWGNFRSGFSSTGCSYLNASKGNASYNRGSGAVAIASNILIKPFTASHNKGVGILAQNEAYIDSVGSTVSHNRVGVSATYSSTVQYGACKTHDNTEYDYHVLTGGKVFATPVPTPNYTPKTNKNFNVHGTHGEFISNASSLSSITLGVGKTPGLNITSSNQTWFAINGSTVPPHRIAVGGWILSDTGVRLKGDDGVYYDIAVVGGALRVTPTN